MTIWLLECWSSLLLLFSMFVMSWHSYYWKANHTKWKFFYVLWSETNQKHKTSRWPPPITRYHHARKCCLIFSNEDRWIYYTEILQSKIMRECGRAWNLTGRFWFWKIEPEKKKNLNDKSSFVYSSLIVSIVSNESMTSFECSRLLAFSHDLLCWISV